jgi:pimeloyl-ACP methyl ester carboxylesterase
MRVQSTAGGHPFEYLVSGPPDTGEPGVLLLPGLLGDAESLWQQIEDFERDHRVISLTYPDSPAVDVQLAAISRALDEQGVEKVVAVGQTLGGFLAQAWAREHPERTVGLALVHASLPSPRLAARLRRDLALMRLVPWPLLRGYLARALRKMIRGLASDPSVEPEQARVVSEHLRERFAGRLDKRRVLARYGLMANLHAGRAPSPEEGGRLAGRVLILHSESNVFARQLDRLKEVYPGARSAVMGRGHNLSLLIKPRESNRRIRELFSPMAPSGPFAAPGGEGDPRRA